MIIRRITISILCGICFIDPTVSVAETSMQSTMGNFWNGLANVTGPKAAQSQAAGHYSLGSVYARTPVVNGQIASLQLPSFRAGCGGIDTFAGAFSFINADHFIALLKGIANNAAGFAFKLALETIAPVISQELGELNDLIQKINQSNINSCQVAQSLVNGDLIDQASQTACEALGNLHGIFSDEAASKQGCGADGNRASTLNSSTSDEKKRLPVARNFAWDAIQQNSYLSASSNQFRQEVMTLSGTIIVNTPPDDNTDYTKHHYSPKALDTNMLTAMLKGGSFTYLSCDDFVECLYPVEDGANENISADQSLSGQVTTLLMNIITAIQTDTPLTIQQQAFVNSTTLPVYKMLNVWTTYDVGAATQMANQYADIIAMDVLYTMIDHMLVEIQRGGDNITDMDKENLKTWKDELSKTRGAIAQQQAMWQGKLNQTIAMIENTQTVERILANNLSGKVAGNLSFARGAIKH